MRNFAVKGYWQPYDTVCVLSPEPHRLKAISLLDSDKHLSLVRFPTTCCLESPDVLSNICRLVLLFDQEGLRIHRTPPLFRGNKNIQLSSLTKHNDHIFTSLEFQGAKRFLFQTPCRLPPQMKTKHCLLRNRFHR